MENKPLGIPNQNYEVWKKIVELRKTYLQGQEPSSREDMLAEIKSAEKEYCDQKLQPLMKTEKDKKLLLRLGRES